MPSPSFWTCCGTLSHTTCSYSLQRFVTPAEVNSARASPELIEQCFAERLAGASGTAHLDHYAARLEMALNEHEHETALGILGHACRRVDGATHAELEDLRRSSEQTFLSVLRDLEADGYLNRHEDRLEFRSNLLREWWRKRYGRRYSP